MRSGGRTNLGPADRERGRGLGAVQQHDRHVPTGKRPREHLAGTRARTGAIHSRSRYPRQITGRENHADGVVNGALCRRAELRNSPLPTTAHRALPVEHQTANGCRARMICRAAFSTARTVLPFLFAPKSAVVVLTCEITSLELTTSRTCRHSLELAPSLPKDLIAPVARSSAKCWAGLPALHGASATEPPAVLVRHVFELLFRTEVNRQPKHTPA